MLIHLQVKIELMCEGHDTLIIQQMGGDNVSGTVSNVENIEFTAFGVVNYDMANTTGVREFYKSKSSVASI